MIAQCLGKLSVFNPMVCGFGGCILFNSCYLRAGTIIVAPLLLAAISPILVSVIPDCQPPFITTRFLGAHHIDHLVSRVSDTCPVTGFEGALLNFFELAVEGVKKSIPSNVHFAHDRLCSPPLPPELRQYPLDFYRTK
jgi:hypothetical protein